jgi:type I restriction enzyme M protein
MSKTEKTRKRQRKEAAPTTGQHGNGANVGFEDKLWAAADKLRGSMEAAEYKHVVLGLIFLKYISDAFEQRHQELVDEAEGFEEERDEYDAKSIFWVPKKARWSEILNNATQPTIGEIIDGAMERIEKENPPLKGTLPKNYARPALDKRLLGELIGLISDIDMVRGQHRSKDLLGRVYEYFLAKFASAEGRSGGEFYTPQVVVRVLVEMLEPFKGRVYDPCCGSGGMFVQSEKFVEAHGGNPEDLAVYGQEWNATTWKLAKMNLAIRGIEANLGDQWADSFHNDKHKGLKAHFVLANPPFNVSDWGGKALADDPRWKYGLPPVGNANFAWVQHIIHHLAPDGVAGVVLANGSMSSTQSGEGDIRKSLVEADLVDCMIALPGQLFYSTQIPVCLWFFARNKADKRYRDRRGEVLFIDARNMGEMVDRTHRALTDTDIERIADTYHAWRGQKTKTVKSYSDVPGFCSSSSLDEVRKNDHVLTPGRYVRAEEAIQDQEGIDAKMPRLIAQLETQLAAGDTLNKAIWRNLRELGYGR